MALWLKASGVQRPLQTLWTPYCMIKNSHLGEPWNPDQRGQCAVGLREAICHCSWAWPYNIMQRLLGQKAKAARMASSMLFFWGTPLADTGRDVAAPSSMLLSPTACSASVLPG